VEKLRFYLLNDWPRQTNSRNVKLFTVLYNNFANYRVIDFHVWLLNFQFWFRFRKKCYHNDSCEKGYKEYQRKVSDLSQAVHLTRTMLRYAPSEQSYGFSASSVMNPLVMCPYCNKKVAAFQLDFLEFAYYKHPHEPKYNSLRLDILNWHLSYTYL